jgi:CHASE3 domain sensor protein
MTTAITVEKVPPEQQSRLGRFIDGLPGAQTLKNRSIGVRLIIGFGVMIAITMAAVLFNYFGSSSATTNINRTDDVRVPAALASSQAQASLLRMLSDVRGYLALGQPEFRVSYEESRRAFESDLGELKQLSDNLNPENQRRLKELEAAFIEWSELPDELFALRDDQLEREPAYNILATDGILLGGTVLIELSKMIEEQGQREATAENIDVLADMAQFQGTFASMLSGLRGYVTTRNRTFKGEYEANRTINDFAWERLQNKRNSLTPSQQESLDKITESRTQFLELPVTIFDVLESEQWRRDLYLFSVEAVPLTEKMQQLLAEITLDQQVFLQNDLNAGRVDLDNANQQMIAAGIVALVFGVVMVFLFRENIGGPIVRLTHVADRIRGGDLEARATVESTDETGALAFTFNDMTSKLHQTLGQVRKEKKRADDLLDVVIPIGVELSAEKDFNRLLENMLVQAKTFCNANGGLLYLRRANEEQLRFVIVREDTRNIALGGTTAQKILYDPVPLRDAEGNPNHRDVVSYAALSGETVNIADTATETKFDYSNGSGDQVAFCETARSMLVLPVKNTDEEVLGVMQLLDAVDAGSGEITPFDENLERMMASFSSLAAAALEAYIREESLKQEIQQLKIEIDETKRQQQVSEIVDTDFFSDLQARAQEIRKRGRRGRKKDSSAETGLDSLVDSNE